MSKRTTKPVGCLGKPAVSRTRNAAATREAILQAARQRFLREGYDQTGLRGIAADAGIDAALICRYFGSKEGLFNEVLASISQDPMEVLNGSRDTLGQRLATAILDPSRHSPRMAFIGLVSRSSGSPVARELLLDYMEEQFIAPFVRWYGEQGSRDKAWLLISVLMGVAVLDDLKPAHSASHDCLAATLQAIINKSAAQSPGCEIGG